MAGHPLRPATRQSLGRPLPHQQADRPRAHPPPETLSTTTPCRGRSHPVLATLSGSYPRVRGRLLTCYSPVRRSSTPEGGLSARLACVKHAASVRPEPGSNSPSKTQKHFQQKTNPSQKTTQLANNRQNYHSSTQKNPTTQPQPPKQERPEPDERSFIQTNSSTNTLLSSQKSDAQQLDPMKGGG